MEPRTLRFVAGLTAFAIAMTVLQYGGIPTARAAGTELVSAALSGALPATDPASPAWDAATPLEMPLSAQLVVLPQRSAPFEPSLEVRSLNNATHIAFRISWRDAVKDNRTTMQGQFRDAVAVQVGPAAGPPPVCMGAAGSRLQIMQWKADWQADIEEGFRDLQDAFPNFWVDYYPYHIGKPPYTAPQNFSEEAKLYLVGYHVGNPFSEPLKVSAVEDAVADGFSTITTQRQQDALGRGVWTEGRWDVVITRPRDSGDGQDVPIAATNNVALAVWDGASGDVGSRKSVTGWVTLRTAGGEIPWTLVVGGIAVLLVVIALIALRPKRKRKRVHADTLPEGYEEGP
jgi:hypothetical protein